MLSGGEAPSGIGLAVNRMDSKPLAFKSPQAALLTLQKRTMMVAPFEGSPTVLGAPPQDGSAEAVVEGCMVTSPSGGVAPSGKILAVNRRDSMPLAVERNLQAPFALKIKTTVAQIKGSPTVLGAPPQDVSAEAAVEGCTATAHTAATAAQRQRKVACPIFPF